MYVLEFLVNIFQLIALVFVSYYFVIAFFGLFDTEKLCNGAIRKWHKFAVVVAAHNEERVIGELVKSLFNMKYPRCYFDVFVVADNCSDQTVREAKFEGADVIIRVNAEKKSKGYALAYAFDYILALGKDYDFVSVVDADNVVDVNFLAEMNKQANNGDKVIQGCIDSKNSFDNWLTLSYSLWYWVSNRLFQLSRQNLNIGCKLGGTGFCIAADLISNMCWDATCLAEDAEFTLKLALSGIKVRYNHKAVVYDEKPTTMSCSFKQRKRWIQGNFEVNSRFVKPLLIKAVKERQLEPLHVVLGFWAALAVFVSSILIGITYIATLVNITLNVCVFGTKFWASPLNFSFLSAFLLYTFLLLIVSLAKDKKLTKHVVVGCFGFLVYCASWIPVSITGVLSKNNNEWYHTPHGTNAK